MARNIFTGGTQTTPAPATGQRGRGSTNQRNRNNRGGGGGGGNTVPNHGLYGGKAGEALSNKDPLRYFENLLRRAGMIQDTGSDFDTWSNETLVNDLFGQYNTALTGNQRRSPVDFARQQFGAGWRGKKGKGFQTGTLGTASEGMQDRFENYTANTKPLSYITGQAMESGQLPQNANPEFAQWFSTYEAPRLETMFKNQETDTPGINVKDWLPNQMTGADSRFQTYRSNTDPTGWANAQATSRGLMPANGNQQFADWYSGVYAPNLQREFESARTGNANLNFDAFEAARDPREAQRLFAHRAPQYRQPSPSAPAGGRWSWWA